MRPSMVKYSIRLVKCMGKSNRMKSTKNKKKEDGKFRSKHIKHDPQAESARAVFGASDVDDERK